MTLETGEKPVRTQICVGCRKDFTNRRRDALFCSAACKQHDYRRRLDEKAAADRARALAEQRAAERAVEEAKRIDDLVHALIG
jgi:hypothetical protein